MLILEDHDLLSNWHSYLWMDGKTPSVFTNRYLRRSLLKTWKTLKPLIYPKMPLWMSLLEAVSNALSSISKPLIYANLLDNEGT